MVPINPPSDCMILHNYIQGRVYPYSPYTNDIQQYPREGGKISNRYPTDKTAVPVKYWLLSEPVYPSIPYDFATGCMFRWDHH